MFEFSKSLQEHNEKMSKGIPEEIRIDIVLRDRLSGSEVVELYDYLMDTLPKKYTWSIVNGLAKGKKDG